ncbi:MAG: ATP-binding protein [Lachnospiraceae bacterium]|nr:ATP-binding protein [Lachnospiraceae bacterium]
MEIIRGKRPGAKKVVCYGPEGIGKSTFAAQFPEPLFIDTEGSTKDMDVARTPDPISWAMLLEQAEYVRTHPEICRTLVVDTIDWAEQMCVEHICAKHQKRGIEDFGYGTGYVYTKEEFGRFLNKLTEVVNAGINVVLTAHAQMRKFEQPDEMGSYDRWELKLGKKTTSQTAPLVKEWGDLLLFANYKTMVINVDGQGAQKGKNKAQGGKRVMYTSHHPCWDAKNRYGLPEEMPFDYAGIAGIIEAGAAGGRIPSETAEQKQEPSTGINSPSETAEEASADHRNDASAQNSPAETNTANVQQETGKQSSMIWESNPDNIPQNLKDLMMSNGVCEWDIQNVVGARGYYPADTPIEKYDPGFIHGVLVGAWQKVYAMIKEMKESGEIPFN